MATGKNIGFFVNGFDIAPYLQEFNPEAEAESIDASVLAYSYRSKEGGFVTGRITASGVYDSDSVNLDTMYDVMGAAFAAGTESVVTGSFEAITVGGAAVLMNAINIKHSIKVQLGLLITTAALMESNNAVNAGVWLANAQLNAGTNNGTSVDNAASSANGGLFHVHLHNGTATDCDFKVQHSTNNSVWVDLTGATVNNLSATNASGSATVATGTTVNRYIRVVSTITGGNTVLVSAAFARR